MGGALRKFTGTENVQEECAVWGKGSRGCWVMCGGLEGQEGRASPPGCAGPKEMGGPAYCRSALWSPLALSVCAAWGPLHPSEGQASPGLHQPGRPEAPPSHLMKAGWRGPPAPGRVP